MQSLGRHDINAPLRVANAEAAASAQWAGVVEKAAKGFGDVFTGQSKARGALTLAELRAKHTTENNALQTLLENKRSFEVGGEGNPEQFEAYAENNSLLAGEVMLTSDIMADVMSYQY
ncbi:MAG: hypothetical protein GY815_04450, partial [Gammaproteobacteria bacterium]|nr:hypothetical protein [Gammaproteobacteria bacterium]